MSSRCIFNQLKAANSKQERRRTRACSQCLAVPAHLWHPENTGEQMNDLKPILCSTLRLVTCLSLYPGFSTPLPNPSLSFAKRTIYKRLHQIICTNTWSPLPAFMEPLGFWEDRRALRPPVGTPKRHREEQGSGRVTSPSSCLSRIVCTWQA